MNVTRVYARASLDAWKLPAEVGMIRATAVVLWATSSVGAGISAWAGPIHIESATYGANCGAQRGDATRELALHCDSLETCRYLISMPATFDVQKRCRADFIAEWSCGPGEFHRADVAAATNDGDVLVLTCVASTGAGK